MPPVRLLPAYLDLVFHIVPRGGEREWRDESARHSMNQKEIKELIEFLVEKDISEFELERGDVKVRVKRGADSHIAAVPMVAPQTASSASHVVQPTAALLPVQAAPAAPKAAAVEAVEEAGLHIVRSPIVGSYYESPSPGSPPFVKVGDEVQVGQVLCIVEAMKLMNEIESDAAGEVVKILVANSQPVEYGQPLFAIRTK
jgi:acetyl-CoA carboxylase biotin carboxyl carrier protein